MSENEKKEYETLTKTEKKELIESISEELSCDQRLLLIKVLGRYDITYDKNHKSIYVVISNIPDNILYYMKKFVDSCIQNKRLEKERLIIMKAAKKDLEPIPLGGKGN